MKSVPLVFTLMLLALFVMNIHVNYLAGHHNAERWWKAEIERQHEAQAQVSPMKWCKLDMEVVQEKLDWGNLTGTHVILHIAPGTGVNLEGQTVHVYERYPKPFTLRGRPLPTPTPEPSMMIMGGWELRGHDFGLSNGMFYGHPFGELRIKER